MQITLRQSTNKDGDFSYNVFEDLNQVTLQTVKSQHTLKFQIEYLRQKINEFQKRQEAMKLNYLAQYEQLMKNGNQLKLYRYQHPFQYQNSNQYDIRQLSPIRNSSDCKSPIYLNCYSKEALDIYRSQASLYNRNRNIALQMKYLQDLKNKYSDNLLNKSMDMQRIVYSDEDDSVYQVRNISNPDSISNLQQINKKVSLKDKNHDQTKANNIKMHSNQNGFENNKAINRQQNKQNLKDSSVKRDKSYENLKNRSSSKNRKQQKNTYFKDLKTLKAKLQGNCKAQMTKNNRVNFKSYKNFLRGSRKNLNSYDHYKQFRQKCYNQRMINTKKIIQNIKNRVVASSCVINKIDHANLFHNTKNVQQRYHAQNQKKNELINELFMHLLKNNKKYAYPLYIRKQLKD